MIMNWPVTSKSYSICGENEKTRSNRKSNFRNNLQINYIETNKHPTNRY